MLWISITTNKIITFSSEYSFWLPAKWWYRYIIFNFSIYIFCLFLRIITAVYACKRPRVQSLLSRNQQSLLASTSASTFDVFCRAMEARAELICQLDRILWPKVSLLINISHNPISLESWLLSVFMYSMDM